MISRDKESSLPGISSTIATGAPLNSSDKLPENDVRIHQTALEVFSSPTSNSNRANQTPLLNHDRLVHSIEKKEHTRVMKADLRRRKKNILKEAEALKEIEKSGGVLTSENKRFLKKAEKIERQKQREQECTKIRYSRWINNQKKILEEAENIKEKELRGESITEKDKETLKKAEKTKQKKHQPFNFIYNQKEILKEADKIKEKEIHGEFITEEDKEILKIAEEIKYKNQKKKEYHHLYNRNYYQKKKEASQSQQPIQVITSIAEGEPLANHLDASEICISSFSNLTTNPQPAPFEEGNPFYEHEEKSPAFPDFASEIDSYFTIDETSFFSFDPTNPFNPIDLDKGTHLFSDFSEKSPRFYEYEEKSPAFPDFASEIDSYSAIDEEPFLLFSPRDLFSPIDRAKDVYLRSGSSEEEEHRNEETSPAFTDSASKGDDCSAIDETLFFLFDPRDLFDPMDKEKEAHSQQGPAEELENKREETSFAFTDVDTEIDHFSSVTKEALPLFSGDLFNPIHIEESAKSTPQLPINSNKKKRNRHNSTPFNQSNSKRRKVLNEKNMQTLNSPNTSIEFYKKSIDFFINGSFKPHLENIVLENKEENKKTIDKPHTSEELDKKSIDFFINGSFPPPSGNIPLENKEENKQTIDKPNTSEELDKKSIDFFINSSLKSHSKINKDENFLNVRKSTASYAIPVEVLETIIEKIKISATLSEEETEILNKITDSKEIVFNIRKYNKDKSHFLNELEKRERLQRENECADFLKKYIFSTANLSQ